MENLMSNLVALYLWVAMGKVLEEMGAPLQLDNPLLVWQIEKGSIGDFAKVVNLLAKEVA